MSTFATPAPAFFIREKPISSSRKPACMNITRMAATITHVVSTAEAVSVSVGPSAAAATAGGARATSEAPPKRAARRRGPARSVRLNIEGSSLVAEAPRGHSFPTSQAVSDAEGQGSLSLCRESGQAVSTTGRTPLYGAAVRYGALAGAVGVVLFAIGGLLVGERPPLDADAVDLSAYMAANGTRIEFACVLFGAAAALFAWFLASVAAIAPRREAGFAALACGLVFLALFLADCTALA